MPTKLRRHRKNEDFCQRAMLGWEILVKKPDLLELWAVGLRSNGNFSLTADGFELNYGGFPSVKVWKRTPSVLEVTVVLSPIHKFLKSYALTPEEAVLSFQDLFFARLPQAMKDVSDALQQETEESRASGYWYGQEREDHRQRPSGANGKEHVVGSAA